MGRPKRYETLAAKQKAYRNRKKNLSGGVVVAHEVRDTGDGGVGNQMQGAGSIPDRSKIQELRELIETESRRVVEEPVKPVVFRNDYGAIITERQWKTLQEKKRRAREGGYTLDDYSQG